MKKKAENAVTVRGFEVCEAPYFLWKNFWQGIGSICFYDDILLHEDNISCLKFIYHLIFMRNVIIVNEIYC